MSANQPSTSRYSQKIRIFNTKGQTIPNFLGPLFFSVKIVAWYLPKYSRVPNKQTGCLLENEKKSRLFALIQTYTFTNFQQKVPPIHLFPLTLLLIFVLSMAHFDLRRPQKPLWGHNQKLINYKRIFYWNTKQPLLYPIECFQKSHLYFY